MITATRMLYLYAETPLHAGVGSGLSSIDLPIQRERTTQYPMIQGSGIKGKLRAAADDATKGPEPILTKEEVVAMFGPERDGAEHAGALIAGDARLLLFPVRSLNGIFAYTTSYDVLNRFARDAKHGGKNLDWKLQEGHQVQQFSALVTTKNRVTADNKLVLEEFSFDAKKDSRVDEIARWIADEMLPQTEEYTYWRNKVKDSLVILTEDDFRDFALHATEIITRIRIDRDKKTVESGALWTEEHLPTDTLLYVPVYATDARKMKKDGDKDVPTMLAAEILNKAAQLEKSQKGYLQLGGDETVGRGMVRIHWGQ